MIKHFTALGLIAVLAACNKSDHTIVAGGPADDPAGAESANVVLPPSIQESKTYRCADNSIVHIDWLSDGKSANIRSGKDITPTLVTAAEDGQPMTADGGYSLDGSAAAGSVRIAVPDHGSQSCKA